MRRRRGRQGSEVARLAAAGGSEVEAGAPYAELWMGTHPSGPSQVRASGEPLREHVRRRPAALGARVVERFGEDLPFLFKVLSVRTALSIQAHPDKGRAERLHAERPHVYKDANHKPEMALALTDFEALSGFVESDALARALEETPELQACVGEGAEGVAARLRGGEAGAAEALREAFGKVMRAEPGLVERLTGALVARLGSQEASGRPLGAKDALVLRLHEQYPGDVGIFAAFFLNYIQLKPGEAIYLDANEPHAYVAGDIVEAMATSDNVVRAGLTPKLRDTDVLCEMLTYNTLKPEILRGEEVRPGVKRYRPPFAEFQVEAIEVAPGASLDIPECPGASILLVQRGGDSTASFTLGKAAPPSEAPISEGGVFFAAANAAVTVSNGGDGPLKIFRCCPNDSVFEG